MQPELQVMEHPPLACAQAAELQASVDGHKATLAGLERTTAALEAMHRERDDLAAELAASMEALAERERLLAEARVQQEQQAAEADTREESLSKVGQPTSCSD